MSQTPRAFQRRRKPVKQRCTHHLIASTAQEIAGAFYEEAASNDVFYKEWPDINEFIRRRWKTFIPGARDALLTMLAGNYPPEVKEQIFDAIGKDAVLNPPYAHALAEVNGTKLN